MKVKTFCIGEYQISPSIPFCLYQFISPLVTPPRSFKDSQQHQAEYFNYFCIEDLFSIFDLYLIKQDLIQSFKQYPGLYCKDESSNRSFIQTHVMADIALKHGLYNLVDLCRLDDKDLISGGAIPLLKMTTLVRLNTTPIISFINGFQQRHLDGNEWFLDINSQRPQRLSSNISSSSTLMSLQEDSLIKLPKPSSLLLKRLAPKHGHKKNLTILTPSYNEDVIHAIQSAPLRRISISKKLMKKSPPTKIKSRFMNVPATASAVSAPWPQTSAQARFPSPPIVPSQQPAWGQYRPQLKVPHTPTLQQKTQKQKFLQPFEFLYDHIEQTRVLKTTLDDQIRRSSSLMQTLQSSGTMVESLVRRQVRDMIDDKFESKLRECTDRIVRLEHRLTNNIPISPAISPTTKEQPMDLMTQLMNRIDQLESKLDK